MVEIGDEIVCIDVGVLDYSYEYKPPVKKIKLNNIYIVKYVQDEGFMIRGFSNAYNKRRFMPLTELRKKKLECLKKVIE